MGSRNDMNTLNRIKTCNKGDVPSGGTAYSNGKYNIKNSYQYSIIFIFSNLSLVITYI